mgnify:FL=1
MIKFCAIVISAFVVAGILVVAILSKGDRVGLLAFGLYFTFATNVIAIRCFPNA